MMADCINIWVPFPVFPGGFRCTQALNDLFHLHGEHQAIRIPFDRIDQFSVLFPVQGFCHVIRPMYGPSHPPVLHPHCDRRTVLVFLHSHVFIHNPLRCFRQFDPPFLVWDQPLYLSGHHSLCCPHKPGYISASHPLSSAPGAL